MPPRPDPRPRLRARVRPRRRRALLALLAVLASVAGVLVACGDDDGGEGFPVGPDGKPAAAAVDRTGSLPNGTEWRLRAPEDWNGTLLLHSRGSVLPGRVSVALDSPDETTAKLLLDRGFALVGSSYEGSGWVLASAVEDQYALLDVVADELGRPERTVAWGHSLGGLVTVGLAEQHPDDIDGAIALCGVVGGPAVLWDTYLDPTFVMRTLLAAGRPLELADFHASPKLAQGQLGDLGLDALATPQGRARLALAGAVADVPAWAPAAPRPAPGDLPALVTAQATNLGLIVAMGTTFRADVETRVGGNPSSNVGVDYAALLGASRMRPLVEAAYAAAGLDLAADLAALAAAPRIEADDDARRTLVEPVEPTGRIDVPVLTLHNSGDGVALPFHPREYAARVGAAGRSPFLRQAVVDRAGHCAFSAAELVTVLDAVIERIDRGAWPDTRSPALNAAAQGLGPDLNVATAPDGRTAPMPPAFVETELPLAPRTAAGTGSRS